MSFAEEDHIVRIRFFKELTSRRRELVVLPEREFFHAGFVNKVLAEILFPPAGTGYDRYAAMSRFVNSGGQTDMLGLELAQCESRLWYQTSRLPWMEEMLIFELAGSHTMLIFRFLDSTTVNGS